MTAEARPGVSAGAPTAATGSAALGSSDQGPRERSLEGEQPADPFEEIRVAWRPLAPVLLPLGSAIVVGVGYAVLRSMYAAFYSPFGVVPEEVGLDGRRIVSEWVGSIGPILRYATYLLAVAAAMVVVYLLVAAARSSKKRAQSGSWAGSPLQRALLNVVGFALPTTVIGVLLPVGLLGAFGFLIPYVAQDMARATQEVVGEREISSDGFPVVEFQRVPARVHWIGDGAAPRGLEGNDALVYLGGADGVSVLWDNENRRTWRISNSDVVLELRPSLIEWLESRD